MPNVRGIPYASAPRFGAPRPIAYDSSRKTHDFGPAAPQPVDGPLGEIVPGMNVHATSEDDCLTLNVWTPDDAEGLKPVLVWFHGGSFVIGASSQAVYDGTRLANEQDVVVVSVNYRLGAFGFLDARSFGGVTNCGLRDAICALGWVRDHIAAFGGDPERVVAFGESAGGGLVLHALASPATRGLLSGAIVQSGATFATLDSAGAAEVLTALTAAAGVDDPARLRDLSADDLVHAQSKAMGALLATVGMMPFHPMAGDDLVPLTPVDAFHRGTAAGVALVAGTTADEMRLFVDPTAAPPSRDRLTRRAARYLGVDDAAAGRIVDGYAEALDRNDTNDIWRAMFGDHEMQAPCRAVLEAHAPHGPAYTYCFTWEGPDVGACHGIDIPFPFGNFVDGWDAFVGLDERGEALSTTMRSAWTAFARAGDPGWPRYPSARILGRETHDVAQHPLFARLPAI
ncbi:MAG TPA: carboxylesterase family protein [Acidimicrobiia bacterium]|nr:carboxylesterase family protein [Acidimicrobiia bacterium]